MPGSYNIEVRAASNFVRNTTLVKCPSWLICDDVSKQKQTPKQTTAFVAVAKFNFLSPDIVTPVAKFR